MAEHQNLALRERLKEIYRQKLRRENDENRNEKFSLPPKVNYGSFFGPSETIFTIKNMNTSTNFTVKKLTSKEFPKMEKIQKIREARDYSFLLSENQELKPPEKPVQKSEIKKRVSGSVKMETFKTNVKKPVDCKLNLSKKRSFEQKPGRKPEIKKPASGSIKQQTFNTNVKKPVDYKLKMSKKRPWKEDFDDYCEGEKALSIVRRMFNTQRFAGRDDSDRVMEASFGDIAKEEERSARLAKKEDEEQLRLIVAEEKRIHIAKRKKQTLV